LAKRVTKDNFQEEVLESTLPVLVEFYSDSCVACKRLAPILGDLEDSYEGKISVVKVNTNYDHELSGMYDIMSNPTLILFVNGEKVVQKSGVTSLKEIEKWIEEYL